MKKIYVLLAAVLCSVLAVVSCDGSGSGANANDNAVQGFRAGDRIALPFASVQKMGRIVEGDEAESSSITGCYTYHEVATIDDEDVTVYLGLQLTSDGKVKSFYAVSKNSNSGKGIVWHKDSGGEAWDVSYSVGTTGEGEEERGVLVLSDSASGKVIGILYYSLEDGKLVISDGTEDGSIELDKAEDGIFDDATDPTADFYGSGSEDDPYMIGWVKTDNAYVNDKLEGCFVCNDFDFSGEGVSLYFGIKFELEKEDEEATGARIYQYFTRDDFVENETKVYAYDFENPNNEGMLCKFKERLVDPDDLDSKVTNLIMWDSGYEGDCCGQIPIYFDTDDDGNVVGFWLDSCCDNWAYRSNHDGDNQKYFYHYVKTDNENIFDNAFDYMDYIRGEVNF